MSNETEALMLKAVLEQYATPDPKIVGVITKNGVNLDFVGHAEITRILIEIDPMWNWQPAGWVDGRPAIHESNGVATMWGNLTLLNKTLLGVGTAATVMTTRAGEKFSKPDYEKELIGDFLRNAAMRFGICLSLWSKQDWEQSATVPTSGAFPQAKQNNSASPMTIQQIEEVFTKPATNQQSPKIRQAEASQVRIKDDSPIPDYPTSNTETTQNEYSNVQPIRTQSNISLKQKNLIAMLSQEHKLEVVPLIKDLFNKDNLDSLTTKEGSEFIKHLMNQSAKQEIEQPF